MTPGDSETTGSYCRRFSTVTARPKPNARCRVGCAAGKSGPPLALLQKRGRGPSLDRDASAQADLARPGGGQPTQRNMKPRSGNRGFPEHEPAGVWLRAIKDSCQSTSRYVSHKVSPWNDLVLVAGNIKPLLCELPTSQKQAPMLPQLFVDDSSGVVDNRAGSAAIFRQR